MREKAILRELYYDAYIREPLDRMYSNVATFTSTATYAKPKLPWYDDPERVRADLWERIYRPQLELLRLSITKGGK